ncbi:NAD kinase [Phocaeicola coprophilus]|uniref:NAD kinase n=1 Tax=Phocaeicola coprophilus TaxID=387090 RepID=UPI00255C83F3|nr:NAD kinase [Phocaeicola coprophilus]
MQQTLRFALFGNTYQEHKSAHVTHLLEILRRRKAQICISNEFYDFLRNHTKADLSGLEVFEGNNFSADMVLSIGGDGTFLKAASRVGKKEIPILGINTGRLGFLADVLPDQMEDAFDEIYQGNYLAEPRRVLKLTCNGHVLKGYPYGLNEIAVLKRDTSSMITIHAYINREPLNVYQADGLVISTPTGSTGYSLSVGGPILVPQSGTISLTAVAPHSLNVRPIVIRDDWEITLDVESRSHNFLIAVDGRSETCREGTRLTIKRADYYVRIVKRCHHSFFNTLREKMMWGMDGRN